MRTTEITVAKSESDVATPSPEWTLMESYRELPRDLRGGVKHLQGAASHRLWRAAKESDKDYDRRKKALQFDPFFWSSSELIGGQPFTKAIRFSDNVPAPLAPWLDNIDGSGLDLRQVARASCVASVGLGLQYLWVVYDPLLNRPFIRVLPESSVLDAYQEGAPIRVHMSLCEADKRKPWVKIPYDQIWVLYDGDPTASDDAQFARYEVFERVERTKTGTAWQETPVDFGTFAPHTKIPVVPVFTGSNSPMDRLPWIVIPPQYDLAAANLSWMNKRSDVDHGLHIGNIPQRAAAGITAEEVADINKVSYNGLWWTSNHLGKFYYLEHQGTSFEVSRNDLLDLERRMEVLGLLPNVTRDQSTGSETATGERRRMQRAITTSQAWALGWQDSWQTALRMAAAYLRLDDSFTLEFNTSFGPREKDLDRAKHIQADYINGDLDPALYFGEMVKLGVYTEGFDVATAVAAAVARRKEMLKAMSDIPAPIPAQIGEKEETQPEES